MRLSEIFRSQYQAYLDGLATEYGLAASTIKTIDCI